MMPVEIQSGGNTSNVGGRQSSSHSKPNPTDMNPKNKQLVLAAVWAVLAVLFLIRQVQGDYPLNEIGGIMGIVATLSFAALAVDAFLKYRKL